MALAAIILAAGKGTRMKSDLPKVLHPVAGRPMLAYVLDACRGAGCDSLLVVVGHGAEAVKSAFAADSGDITWIRQEPQLGTGHAVMVCRESLEELSGPVLVLGGDGPLVRGDTLRTLVETHAAAGAACTLATSVVENPGAYGRILRDANGNLTGIVEYNDATEKQRAIHEVNVSLYCFDAAALRGVLGLLTNNNAKGEYYLTDALELMRRQRLRLAAVEAVPPEDVLSINDLDELAMVQDILLKRGLTARGRAGVCH